MIHLDTNVTIGLINGRNSLLRSRFEGERTKGTKLFMSSIVQFELLFGAVASQNRQANELKIAMLIASDISVIPFDAEDAAEAGEIRAGLKQLGTPIGPYDVLIAGQARRHGAVLVTANTSEFQRVPGLMLVDWSK